MKSGFYMITLNVENHGLTFDIDAKAQYPFQENFALYLMGLYYGYKGVLYYELLQSDEIITADCYQQQLTNLSDALEEKRPFTGQGRRKVILLHKNVRLHIAKAIQDYIFALVCELPHAVYSPDMALSDYYLFRSLQHYWADTYFVRFEEIRKCIHDFIVSKPVSFYRQGICKLRKMTRNR